MSLAILAGLACLTFVVGFARWRRALVLLLLWMLVEDMVRKALPGQPPLVILGKDVILAVIYVIILVQLAVSRTDFRLWLPPFFIALYIYASVVVIQSVRSQAPSFLFVLASLRSYLWYMPVLWLGFNCGGTKEEAFRALKWLTFAAPILTILAIVQRISGTGFSPLLGAYATGHQVHGFGDEMFVLSSSVFGSSARFGRVSLAMFLLSFGMLKTARVKPLRWIVVAVAAAAGTIASASRTAIYCLAATTVLFLWAPRAHSYMTERRLSFMRTGTAMAGMVLLAWLLLGDVANYVFETREAFPQRMEWMVGQVEGSYEWAGIYGYGTGTMSQGIWYLPGGKEYAREPLTVAARGTAEQGFAKIIWELGLVGLIAYLFFWGSVLFCSFKAARRLSGTELSGPGWGIWLFILSVLAFSMLGHVVLGDGHTLVALWFLIGMLFRMQQYAFPSETPGEVQGQQLGIRHSAGMMM